MAQLRPLEKAATLLLHTPTHNVADALEVVRLACLERDIAMDEAASSVVEARRAQIECEKLRDEVKRWKAKKPPAKKATDTSNLMLNLDFVLGVLRDRLGLDVHVIDLKRHVLDHASSTSVRHTAMFKTTMDELADVYRALANAQMQISQLKTAPPPLDTVRTIETMEAAIADRDSKIQALEAQNVSLARVNSDLTNALTASQRSEKLVQEAVDALEAERDELKSQLNATTKCILDTTLDSHREVLSLQAELSHQGQAFDQMNGEWGQRFNAESARVQELLAEAAELHRTIEWLEDALVQERTTTIHCKNELQKAQVAINSQQEAHVHDLAKLSEEAQRDANRLQLALDVCKSSYTALDSKYNDFVADSTQALASQKAEADSLSKECIELQNQVNALTTSSNEHKAAADVLGVHLAMHVRHWKRHGGALAAAS